MAKREVRSPNEKFTGTVAGVYFRDGKGQVDEDDQAALAYFERHGYEVGEVTTEPPPEEWKPGEGDHSVPPGQRLPDALDPEDAEQPNREHTGGRLRDGADMTDEEIEALGLQPHRMARTATRRDGE